MAFTTLTISVLRPEDLVVSELSGGEIFVTVGHGASLIFHTIEQLDAWLERLSQLTFDFDRLDPIEQVC